MATRKTFYLIDFENIGEKGLAGAESLTADDYVHLFSTKNAAKISTATLAKFNTCSMKVHEVPAKSQSLDMHLVSFLGFLICAHGQAAGYVIISNDTDYDNIIKFWKAEENITIERRGVLQPEPKKAAKPAPAPKNVRQPEPSGPAPKNVRPPEPAAPADDKGAAMTTSVQKAVRAAGYMQSVTNTVAAIVSSYQGEGDILQKVHNELRDTYDNPEYLELYDIVKPIITKSAGAIPPDGKKTPPSARDSSHIAIINDNVQRTLSKANFDSKTVGYVASQASRHYGEKDGKQAIYRAIVSKFGQQRGLNIYNHIKKHL